MSNQSGIKVSEELAKAFADAVGSGETRVLRISIEKETLIENGQSPVSGTFEEDFGEVQKYLDESQPAFIVVRLDSKSSAGEYEWLFISYVPDNAKVRDKMLYASTRTSLTKELGDYRFVDSMWGTDAEEFTLQGYKKHKSHQSAEAPLTQRERELAEIKLAESKQASSHMGTTVRKTYAGGVTMPLSSGAESALKELSKSDRPHNYVSLRLDSHESIELDKTATVTADELAKTVPSESPRFTFYAYESQGSDEAAFVFIYTCPPSSKLREKMLYSSSRNGVVATAEKEADIKVAKKLETSDVSDLTEAYLKEELDSQQSVPGGQQSVPSNGGIVGERIQMLGQKPGGFKRPAAPGRRRPAA
ncbi:Twinfilin-1 [Umbelopsis sp. WA50703]